jgi:hypothetical protein
MDMLPRMLWLFITSICASLLLSLVGLDARVLLDTLITYKEEFPFPPEGKYYLVDSGYPNRKGFLAPYKGQSTMCLFLAEWQHGHHPAGSKELFNYAHSFLRNVIEALSIHLES